MKSSNYIVALLYMYKYVKQDNAWLKTFNSTCNNKACLEICLPKISHETCIK